MVKVTLCRICRIEWLDEWETEKCFYCYVQANGMLK